MFNQYGCCEIIATIGVRSIFTFRSACRDTWFEIEGIDRRFPSLGEAQVYAKKQLKQDLASAN